MKKVTCEICDNVIVDGGKTKYCSDECAKEGRRRYNRWYYKNKVKDNSLKECLVCGGLFYPEYNQKMCSDRCVEERFEQYREKHNPPKEEDKECLWCGNIFTSVGGRDFCSDECNDEHVKEYNRWYYQNVTKPKREQARLKRESQERFEREYKGQEEEEISNE